MRTAFASFAIPRHAALAAVVWLAAFTGLRSQAAEDPLEQWEVTAQLPQGSLAYGKGWFVLAGYGGIWSTTNAVDWVKSGSAALGVIFDGNRFLASNCSDALGPTYGVLWSDDGLYWNPQGFAEPTASLTSIAYSRGRHVMGGSGWADTPLLFLTSTDAVNWTHTTMLSAGHGLVAMAAGKGRFVASEGISMYSSADGLTWIETQPPIGSTGSPWPVWDVTYARGRFLAVGYDYGIPPGPGVLTSPNGLDWTRHPSDTLVPGLCVTYGDGVFVEGGAEGRLATSADGIHWTERTVNTTSDVVAVTFGQGRFVAVTQDGTVIRSGVMPPRLEEIRFRLEDSFRLPDEAMLLTVEGPYGQPVVVEASADMVDWEQIATDPCDRGEFEVYDEAAAGLPHRFYRVYPVPPEPPPGPLEQWTLADTVLQEGQTLNWKLAYGNGVFVAAGRKSNNTSGSAWYAEGGQTWLYSHSAAAHEALAFGAGRFVSWASGMPMSSSNGQEWIKHQNATPVPLEVGEITFGRGQFVALGADPADTNYPRQFWFLSSVDGGGWQASSLPEDTVWLEYDGGYARSAVYAKGQMVFLAQYSICSSADGKSWAIGVHFVPDIWNPVSMNSLLYGKGRFLANRDDNRVYRSEDGVT